MNCKRIVFFGACFVSLIGVLPASASSIGLIAYQTGMLDAPIQEEGMLAQMSVAEPLTAAGISSSLATSGPNTSRISQKARGIAGQANDSVKSNEPYSAYDRRAARGSMEPVPSSMNPFSSSTARPSAPT